MAKPTGNIIKLRNVRLSFPCLDEARAPKGQANAKKGFSASFLLDPKNEQHKATIKEIMAEIARLKKETWTKFENGNHPKLKPVECFGKGETKTNGEGQVYSGYEGMYFVSARNDRQPMCMNANKQEMKSAAEIAKTFYGGCYVHATVNFWTQDNEFGQAVRCSLRAVMFAKDGEAFGGGSASVDEFDDVDESEGLPGLDDDLGLDDDIPL